MNAPAIDEPRSMLGMPLTRVLLVHGAWHGAWCWQRGFAARLADAGFDVRAMELVGRGRGPERAGLGWTRVHDYVDEVAAAIEAMDAPPVVVGHSMGALLLRRVLTRGWPRVAGAVLLAPVPRGGVAPLAAKVLAIDPWAALRAHATMSLWPAVSWLAWTRCMFFRSATPQGTVDDTFQRLRDESFRAYLDMLVPEIRRPPLPGRADDGDRRRG
ncbi:MAG: alpha/beta fold hydrolase [Methylobacterium radiotolerans]